MRQQPDRRRTDVGGGASLSLEGDTWLALALVLDRHLEEQEEAAAEAWRGDADRQDVKNDEDLANARELLFALIQAAEVAGVDAENREALEYAGVLARDRLREAGDDPADAEERVRHLIRQLPPIR